MDKNDVDRFFQSMTEFNTINPIGSIFENSLRKEKDTFGSSAPKPEKLVDFVCYCLNPNHYHFVLKQLVDGGIRHFMHRLGTGYTNYFNERYKRTGSLFQGRFKAVYIDSNEYLLYISAYVNLNDRVHKINISANPQGVKPKSSWYEYVESLLDNFCNTDSVLGQFKDRNDYKMFTENALEYILERKDIEKLLLE